jgi:phosphoglycerol transferase MdoB-like AlkP superfamily enzyme
VDDRYLFDFILDTVDAETPSFNFILTTSNHPPYDLDLEALGYHLQDSLPAPLKATKADTVKVLGHLWYADMQAGHFVRQAEKKLEQSLFAITGDHTARLRISFPGDNVAEQTAVPFILYGPDVLAQAATGARAIAGAHQDIPATLIEMAAEPGYRYTAYGENMLTKSSPSFGFGWQFIVGEEFISNDSEQYKSFGLPDGPLAPPEPRLAQQVTRFNALRALAWYRVKKGAELPDTTLPTVAAESSGSR